MQRGSVASSDSPTQPTPYADQHRAQLAAAIAARDAEEARYDALQAAQQRATDERRTAADLLREAEVKLRQIRAENSSRIAYAF